MNELMYGECPRCRGNLMMAHVCPFREERFDPWNYTGNSSI